MKRKKTIQSILSCLLAAGILVGLLGGSMPVDAQAASTSQLKEDIRELEAEKERLAEEIEKLREQLAENEEELEGIIAQKDLIDQEIFILYQQIDKINEQIAAFNEKIAEKQEELDVARANQAAVQEKNKKRLRAMEKNSSTSYWAIILDADNILDMLDRMKMVEEIRKADQRCLDELREAADLVEEAKVSLETEKAALEQTKAELAKTQEELEIRSAEANELLEQAVAKGQEFKDLLEESERKQDEVSEELAQKEKEYNAANAPSGGGGGGGGSANSGGWLIPCSYVYMSSPFGERYHPITGTYTMHYGVDLAANQGTPIKATKSGTIAEAAYNNSAGYYVSIRHGDGFASIYMHMTHYIVSVGQKVEQGQVIGYVGSTGGSTGPHLHFGVLYNGSYVNPANYMNF